ncbi:MAG: LptF/LptG family permease [Myxococcota bacterium]
MRILPRYFVSRFLGLFAAILFASILVIVIVEMLLNLDRMLEVHEGAAGVASYLLLRIPVYYLPDLVPAASFGAAFTALGLGARWQEITAMKAGGIPPLRIALPVLGAALLLSVATGLLNETWGIRASQEWKRQLTGGSVAVDYRRGSFWYHRGRMIYKVRGADRETRTLVDIALFERNRDGRLVKSIHADRARIGDDGVWRFENAVIREFTPDRPGSPPRTRARPETALALALEADQEVLMGADASLLPIDRLREYIDVRSREGEQVQRLVALFHQRLTDPLAVLLLALLGIPLGLRVGPMRGFGRPAILGLALLAGYFLMRNVGHTLAAEGVVSPAVPAWVVLAVFAGIGTWQLARTPR